MEENRLCLGTGRESVSVFTHVPLLPFVTAGPIAHGTLHSHFGRSSSLICCFRGARLHRGSVVCLIKPTGFSLQVTRK